MIEHFDRLINAGDYVGAWEIFPGLDEPWRTLALAKLTSFESHNPDAARDLFGSLLSSPNNEVRLAAIYGFAHSCRELGETEESIKYLQVFLKEETSPVRRAKAMNQYAMNLTMEYKWGSGETSCLQEAEELWSTGISLLDIDNPNHRPEYLAQLCNVSLLYEELGRLDEAIASLELCLENEDSVIGSALTMVNLGCMYGKAKNFPLAEKTLKEALRIINEPTMDRSSGLSDLGDIYLAQGKHDQAIQTYTEAISIAEVVRSSVSKTNRGHFFKWFKGLFMCMVDVYLRGGNIGEAFNYAERSRARALADITGVEPITLDEIEVPDNTAIISYYGVGERLLAFVLNKTGVHVVELGLMSDVELAFDNTGYPRNLMPGANDKLRKVFVLDRIAEQIARPLDFLVGGCERLCIVPFGPLHHIPLSVLFDDALVSTAPSISILFRLSQTARSGKLIVSYGYNGQTLRHAEAEAISVGDVVYIGVEATREAFLTGAGNARWLHVSTHGYFDANDPDRSYIELADGPLYANEIAKDLRISSDLVVLSACDSGRSRILPGDEPFGMIRAFLTAGAASVVCALWPVNEVATRLLMEYFYSNLRSGTKTTEALKNAQKRLKETRRLSLNSMMLTGIPKGAKTEIVAISDDGDLPFFHPYWWAGFSVVGDRLTTKVT